MRARSKIPGRPPPPPKLIPHRPPFLKGPEKGYPFARTPLHEIFRPQGRRKSEQHEQRLPLPPPTLLLERKYPGIKEPDGTSRDHDGKRPALGRLPSL